MVTGIKRHAHPPRGREPPIQFLIHEWSFRRFTYGNLVTTSPKFPPRPERKRSDRSSPKASPDHSIGRSDGRCVQRAGTYSARADEIASVLYIRVHSSRNRHCCIYRYKYISGRDQVEVSKARSKSTTTNNLCFRYSDRVATLRQRNSIKPEWASRKLSDLPTWKWLEQPAHHD
jgi:hypothetical protein